MLLHSPKMSSLLYAHPSLQSEGSHLALESERGCVLKQALLEVNRALRACSCSCLIHGQGLLDLCAFRHDSSSNHHQIQLFWRLDKDGVETCIDAETVVLT